MFRLLGWVVTLALAAVALVSLDPARVGLSTTAPVTQLIALRPVLAAGFGGMGALLLLGVLVGALAGRRRPRRTVLALVFLAVGLGHGWVVYDRGLDDDPLPAAREGALTVLALNTYGGGATADEVVAAAADVGADVLALPETSAESAEAVAADLATRTGTGYQVLSRTTGPWDASSTALLVSERLGEYTERASPLTAHGAVRAEPVDGSGPVLVAVHPISPHEPGDAMERWRRDLAAVTEPCRAEDDVIVAGDFNATLDHAPMRDVGSCVDAAAEAGVGGVATWPARFPRLVGAPIDHVLVDGDRYVVDAAAVLEVGASDHRAVVARVSPTG